MRCGVRRLRLRNRSACHLDAAPVDDEPDTDDERAEADATWEAQQRGEAVPLSDLIAETRP
jgi:hypothetical protein